VHAVAKSLVEDINGCLRSDFAGFGAAHAIRYGEDAALGIAKERILVQRALII
jgi:hypothetical protein